MQLEVSYTRPQHLVGRKVRVAGRLLVVTFLIVAILVIFFSACTLLIALGDLNIRRESSEQEALEFKPSEGLGEIGKNIFPCTGEDCEVEGEELFNGTDGEVDPCDDFYGHVCSKWSARNALYRHESERSKLSLLRNKYIRQLHDIFQSMTIDSALQTAKEKAAAMFVGCMDRDAIEELGADPLRKLLQNLGFRSFPTSLQDRKGLDVSHAAGQVVRRLGLSTFVSVTLGTDPELREDRVLQVDRPALPLGGRLVQDNVYRLSWWQGVMAKTFYYLTKDEMVSSRLAEDIFNLENDITQAQLSAQSGASSKTGFERVLLKSFEPIAQWNWTTFFCAVLGTQLLTRDMYVMVKSVGFVRELGYVFGNNSKNSLLDFIAWRLMLAVSPFLPEAFRDLTFPHSGQQTAGGAPPPYEIACYNVLEPPLRLAFARAYMEEHGATESTAIKRSLRYFLDEILGAVNRSTLMDRETAGNATQKLYDMQWQSAQSINFTANHNVSVLFDETEDISSSRVLEGFYILSARFWESYWNGKLADQGWTIPVLSVLPSYNALRNSLVVPLGATQKPLLYDRMFPPLHVARFGFLTLREMLRSFLGEGSEVDKTGTRRRWWSESSRSLYKKKAYCFVKQSKDYGGPEMDPFESLTENILDGVALQMAFWVYYKMTEAVAPFRSIATIVWKQGERTVHAGKLFFYAFASMMCGRLSSRADYDLRIHGSRAPPPMRVNIPLRNMPTFADAFECDRDTKMNSDRKCFIL